MAMRLAIISALSILGAVANPSPDQSVSIATFNVDATPPLGSPLCGGAVKSAASVDDPLSARGIIIFPGKQQPIVLCAVDWVGIANAGHDAWCEALAEAAGTSVDRVSVHTLHQHDAPACDFTADGLLRLNGLPDKDFNADFARVAINRAAVACKEALQHRLAVTQIGIGQAKVDRFASNRRILGDDGKVKYVRWTATKDPVVRAYPEGTIDPYVKALSFWNGNKPVAVITYYATHPQSHYGEGHVSADTVGMARSMCEKSLPGVFHIHFNGAGGNIGPGKYNDGALENRPILARRLADGMEKAFNATKKTPITASDINWVTQKVMLPLRPEIKEEDERRTLGDLNAKDGERIGAADEIAWIQRTRAGHGVTIGKLTLGPVVVLHMPGELFVEYQLAAQGMRPDKTVCMAAYSDYGPGYIGTTKSYDEGGYETGLHVSRTAPSVEPLLMDTMREILK